MAQEDEGGREDRLLVVGHDKVIALVLPHQIGNGLHLDIYITVKQKCIKIMVRVPEQLRFAPLSRI